MRQKKRYRSKKEFVYETLREEILSGAFQPGARLIIDELANELGVSPIPVREALQQLQSDGFVTIEPYMGARVTEIHAGLIQEVFALLEALEIISGRAACQNMTEADFQEMEALLQRMDGHVADLEEWSQNNMLLHQFICERAGFSLVQNLMLRIMEHWNWLRRHYLEGVFAHQIPPAQRQHWQLLKALRSGDPDYVAQVTQEHNQKALAAYLAYLESTGQLESQATPYT
jgi:DNA-binding GntR family transcriptional regulator